MNSISTQPDKHFAWRPTVSNALLLTLGSVLLALNVDLFLAPANLAPGGVSGMAILIHSFTAFPIGVTMLVLNLPLLVLGYQNLGRFHFLTRTLYVVLLYNLGTDLLAPFLPPHGITQDLLLNALFSGVLGGLATGIIYRAGGTSAGTGIISRVVQMKTGMPLSQIYMLTDGAVILAAGLVFGWNIALYSLITLFVWGLATDYALEGPSVVRTVFIVTDHADEITRELFAHLHVGVTAWTGEGMFTEHQHRVLFCTVNRPDVNTLKLIIAATDPHAFVVIGQGQQAHGGIIK